MYVLLLYKHTSHTRGNSRGLSTTQLSGTLYVVVTSTALRAGNSNNSSFPYILIFFFFGCVGCGHRPSYSTTCGIFPNQRSNLCLPHWPVNVLTLNHQGGPLLYFLFWTKPESWSQNRDTPGPSVNVILWKSERIKTVSGKDSHNWQQWCLG